MWWFLLVERAIFGNYFLKMPFFRNLIVNHPLYYWWTFLLDPIYNAVTLIRIERKEGTRLGTTSFHVKAPYNNVLEPFKVFAFFHMFLLLLCFSFSHSNSFISSRISFLPLCHIIFCSSQRKLLLWNLRPFKSNANAKIQGKHYEKK